MAQIMQFSVPSKTQPHVMYKFQARKTHDNNMIYFFNNSVTTKELYDKALDYFMQQRAKNAAKSSNKR